MKLLSINAKHSVRNLLVRHHAQSNTEEFVQPSPANLMNETVTVPEKSPTGTSAMSTRGCLGHSGSKLITARGKSSLNHDAEYMSEHRSSSSRWLDLEEASIYVPDCVRSGDHWSNSGCPGSRCPGSRTQPARKLDIRNHFWRSPSQLLD